MIRRYLWLSAFWLAVLAGIVVSLMPAPPLPDALFAGADKVQHAAAYAVLFVLGRQAGYRVLALALGLITLGAAIEIAQGAFTTSRSAEWFDLAADVIGVGLGHLMAMAAGRKRARSARVEEIHRR